jgi:hypothetical protein
MVRKLEINYGEALRALCLVNHVLDSGNWEEVTHHVLIQDAVGFLLKKTRLKQPKESYRSDESLAQELFKDPCIVQGFTGRVSEGRKWNVQSNRYEGYDQRARVLKG